ncbi:MAG: formate C-acetyltransferase/glycerol dehydratase family glycyl radical enzyme [Clostridia bacterium]|jgi:formate C-acetyltransferase|nr:formate C-acetyltransferase/glycerol dehydratase family glycyl radical enzyme [Clostridia bacterium]MCI1999793.1 formate C-acetyltransferase/glycerol dehydratase family glycyl radical enzyme [Clostridia bacterium]MCI2014291.1 formate C-acetyltransferase/glycerol dehydratase family glycyl radical enzyme [Clostridia bacterium]
MITDRIEKIRQNYVNTKPAISYERALIWTESHKKTEGLPICIRRAQAFYDCCDQIGVHIFDGELIVGAVGEFRKCGILTPEFSWMWVDSEMDNFATRSQDPYIMTDEQRKFVRKNIFPYWKGKSLEEAFLKRIPEDTKHIGVDTGVIDSDSKWRQAVGEVTPDYQDVLFKKGFGGIIKEAEGHIAALDMTDAESEDKRDFYESIILTSKGIIRFANRYADEAERMAAEEDDKKRAEELRVIAKNCRKVPEHTPESFYEAIQFIWFVQIGGILSENPLSLNPGRFDQYMDPYYESDIKKNAITESFAQELIEALWLKYSEWVWTISANTADYFAGYNQFQNLTVGGKKSDGKDGTNPITYMALKATEEVKTHQPGLSVRVQADCPKEFMDAVTHLVSKGTGFPAIHNDSVGYQMLINAGYEPEDAKDWNNCGCVVPHFRKTGEWTAAVNMNFGSALEYALNQGKSLITGEKMGLSEKPAKDFKSYEEVKDAFYKQFNNLCKHSIILTVEAQRLHKEMVPRPFLSSCIENCMDSGKDLSQGGAKYNIGPVITGIGLAVVSNSLAAVKKLVFEDHVCTMETLAKALQANWEGYEDLREKAQACPKYGNDDDYVDDIAIDVANHFYREIHQYKDIFGSPFNTAFMGISNYIPMGRVLGATPCGRKNGDPSSEGVSPYVGTDKSTPLAAMKSTAKVNQEIHSGGTLLNLRLNPDLVATKRGQANLGSMIQTLFSLGGFHVQFNCISSKVLRDAQAHPENYKDLLVRVAGYSTQFVNLSKSMQDAIIARTEHSF